MSVTSGSGRQVGTVLRAPKTAELIATHLRRQIVRGELKPGKTLPPEIQLMEQFGVSRPTLREAFRILEAETLINVRRGSRGGAQVMAPDISVAARYIGVILQVEGTTIDDVYQARMVSEPACARLLAENRTDEVIADLSRVVEALEAEVDAQETFVPDPDVWSSLTYRFHELILQNCGNRTLALQGAVLQDIVATHLRTRIASGYGEHDTPERFQRAIRSYRKFIRLITEKDAEGAEELWRSHMEAAAQYLLKDDLRTKPVVDLFS
ncbi:GntR family transcriptional regulator [Actinocorallia herbida]|uniref:GntR family transcriptional regulator n=1 Tax=Actinocorallia herbida TaxID=58109 RepID=A0A3N1D1S3_9ACTN|nr:FCD domain-containing protein [Actinocorallia herbida]ROO87462.1 GntR family transcriptional regulator [Actinocorallia herbida]